MIDRKNLILLGSSLIISILLIEVLLRLLIPKSVSEDLIRVDDLILGHKLLPNKEMFQDDNGYKNLEIPDKVDIVALGDSHTYGIMKDIEGSWPSQLSEISGKSVYNMGVGGYGPVQYSYLIDRAISKNPETVILGFYLGNDLYDVHRMVYENEYWKDLRSSQSFSIETPSQDNFFDAWQGLNGSFSKMLYDKTSYLRSHSRLFSILSNIYWNINAGSLDDRIKRVKEYSNNNPSEVFVFERDSERAILNSEYRFKYMDLNEPAITESWRISQDLFKDIKNKLDSKGINLVIVLIPTKEMVFEEWFRISNRELPREFKGVSNIENILRSRIKDFCVGNDINCLDLLPSLANSLNDGVNSYPEGIDGHPTIEGYEVIAKTIDSYILNNND